MSDSLFSNNVCDLCPAQSVSHLEYKEVVGTASLHEKGGEQTMIPIYGIPYSLCYPHYMQAVHRELCSNMDENVRQKTASSIQIGFGSSNNLQKGKEVNNEKIGDRSSCKKSVLSKHRRHATPVL